MRRSSLNNIRLSLEYTKNKRKNILQKIIPSQSIHVQTFITYYTTSSSTKLRFNANTLLKLKTPTCQFSTDNDDEFQVKVPSMGDSISEGTIVQWVKGTGDYVAADEVILVLETDKVSVDVRSPESGIILKQLAKIDETVQIGTPLVSLSRTSAPPADAKTTVESNIQSEAVSKDNEDNNNKQLSKTNIDRTKLIQINVPPMGDSISEGTIVKWAKGPGDFVNVDEVIVILETDKVSVDVRSPAAGTIVESFAKIDQALPVGAPLCNLMPGSNPKESENQVKPTRPAPTEKCSTSVAPEKIIENKTKENTIKTNQQMSKSTSSANIKNNRTVHREKMSRMRMRIAERLKESQNIAASLTTFQECDMGKLIDFRNKYKESFEKKYGIKLGFMSAFVKATTNALLEVPALNGMIDNDKKEIIYRNYVDMSVAVATPKGLVTPVLRNTEEMSFKDIEMNLVELATKARNNLLTLEEMQGGNFTISNGGVFGSLMGTPILNTPQSGILGMHATKMRPVVHEGKIVIRPMMYLALTYDHRLVDGREAVTCLKSIAEKIEDPERLLLDL